MFLGPELLLQRLDPYLRTADMQLGALVRNKRERRARETAEQGLLVVGRIGIFNDGERLISDIAEARRELQHRQIERGVFGLEVLAGFHYVPDAGGGLRLVVSFRSLGAVDVAAIAKANGGGGHTLAAGFTLASASGPLGCILHALTLAGRGDLLLE
jgi:nanoRNase/pAp phosphatase (c-di-AMP/oligoRNAs hydrolase)